MEEYIKEIRLEEEGYPVLLKGIKNPPNPLYIQGSFDPNENHLAVVGTRHFSEYGKLVVSRFVKDLAQAGLVIVSGLALGIDSLVHQAALEAGGKTIAVLGSGLDVIYPYSNRSLVKKIIEKGGAIISEHPLGTKPFKGNFPTRNRIISGISLGVLVIECPEKSGAMITARYAFEQGRKVFAVPGDIFKKNSQGTNKLIKLGARLVEKPQDILEVFGLDEVKVGSNDREVITDEKEKLILKYLSGQQSVHIDRLIELTGLPAREIGEILTTMEIQGKVKSLGNGYYHSLLDL